MKYVYIIKGVPRAEGATIEELEWCERQMPGGKFWPWDDIAGAPHPMIAAMAEWQKELAILNGATPDQPAVDGAQTL
jgi:hypothetical protein